MSFLFGTSKSASSVAASPADDKIDAKLSSPLYDTGRNIDGTCEIGLPMRSTSQTHTHTYIHMQCCTNDTKECNVR